MDAAGRADDVPAVYGKEGDGGAGVGADGVWGKAAVRAGDGEAEIRRWIAMMRRRDGVREEVGAAI